MENAKHTPGTWRIASGRTHIYAGAEYIAEVFPRLITESEGEGAHWDKTSIPLAEANARLIAASPEMYDALEEAEKALSHMDDVTADPGVQDALEYVRDALKKAVGVQS